MQFVRPFCYLQTAASLSFFARSITGTLACLAMWIPIYYYIVDQIIVEAPSQIIYLIGWVCFFINKSRFCLHLLHPYLDISQ